MYPKTNRQKRFSYLFLPVMLCFLALGFSGCGAQDDKDGKTERTPENYTQNAEDAKQNTPNNSGGVQSNSARAGEQKLDKFTAIEVHAQAPDIRLIKGDGYSVRYQLHSREKLSKLEVQNGVLYLETIMDSQWAPDEAVHEIVITVPSRAKLERVDLNTVGGKVSLSDFKIPTLNLSSASDDIDVKNVESESMVLHSTADDISVMDCIAKTLRADSTSDDIVLSGAFGDVQAETASGTCKLNGKVTGKVQMNTVSGNIILNAPVESLTAESYRGVTVDGVSKGNAFSFGSGTPQAILKSVTGTIMVQTKK